ncbi:hypothetical protein HZY97_16175 [Sphingomonas sp. R-74633]|uniref:hypothetical protein n=1 Tax=Sphingomonas sp. R-74633 TaxID=2751188 RepID=UPI0015D1164C|nr:hypothetical protein [Sphingomonas sp. R-74633]NYT42310.1 hypothetical protein [Sphingomonas sp. R-74633]
MSAAVSLMLASGPVGAAFRACLAFLTLVMGPVGSGKTTDCIAKGVQCGAMQEAVWDQTRLGGKGCFVRKCRGAVVRDTYPNLDRTVIKSWWKWFPKNMGHWSGEAPRTHRFTLDMWDHSDPAKPFFFQLDMEVLFIAIGDNAVEDVLRGLELTWLWLNETDLLSRAIIEIGIGRVGRYPSGKDGRCLFPQIFCDMNAPEEDNWTVPLFIEKQLDPAAKAAIEKRMREVANDNGPVREVIGFYRQPGGLEDGAENLQNLPGGRGYYELQVAVMAADKARRMVHNRIGPVRKGTLVYPEFVDDLLYDDEKGAQTGHVREFDVNPRWPVLIGADQDVCPGLVFAQLDPQTDQLMIFDELARIFENEDGNIVVSQMGGEAFGRQAALHLATHYPALSVGLVTADPAGSNGEKAIEGTSWRRQFQKGLGVNVRKCTVPGNSIELRTKAIRDRLGSKIPGKPQLVVHRRCTILRKAFTSRYVFKRIAAGGAVDSGKFADAPVKAQGYSDVMNAAEYLAFEVNKGLSFSAVGPAATRGPGRQIVNDSEYEMFGRVG